MIYFDDLEIGAKTLIGTRVVPKADAIEFASRWEPQPHHIDEAAAKDSPFGGLTLCSLHLFAIVTRLFFDAAEPWAVQVMLGKDEIRLPNPARPDEELRYTTEVVDKRLSKSRPDTGIVTVRDELLDPRDQPVLTQKVTLMMATRPA